MGDCCKCDCERDVYADRRPQEGARVRITIDGVVKKSKRGAHWIDMQNEFGSTSHRVYVNQDDVTIQVLN